MQEWRFKITQETAVRDPFRSPAPAGEIRGGGEGEGKRGGGGGAEEGTRPVPAGQPGLQVARRPRATERGERANILTPTFRRESGLTAKRAQ